jgi:hypothetical protein
VNVENLLCRSFAVIFSSIMLAILQSQPIFFPSWQIDHLIWVKGSGFRVSILKSTLLRRKVMCILRYHGKTLLVTDSGFWSKMLCLGF